MWSLRKIQASDIDFLLAQQIRTAVFVQEQGVDSSDEYDAFEEASQHYLVSVDNKAVATARWRFTPNGIKLERFAVLTTHRGEGIGQFLVKHMIKEVQKHSRPIYLHAQIQVAEFYQKLGFEKEGVLFEEAGIQHIKMVFKQ
tara:strand:- start:1379 stop:1804 length:426 start_codon:yes stop_codon:yes gene_type:complete